LFTSAVDGRGIVGLWDRLHAVVADRGLHEAVGLGVILNERHQHKLQVCRQEISLLLEQLEDHDPGPEVVGTMLSSILSQFGEISGRVFSEQLLESIFSRFCVGK
jgi:tRNA U34 5-carboxymethylaminomethyl modifying GTPase MnmE/TrmE